MEIQNIPNAIDSAGSLRQFAVNLFLGWGYNAYRAENKLRADDILVRNEASDMLTQVRAALQVRERNWRRDHLPAPTRENPYPDTQAIAVARSLERLQQDVESLEVLVRTASVPEDDRTWMRHRNEADTLRRLHDADIALVEAVIELAHQTTMATASGEGLVTLDLAPVRVALEARKAILRALN